MFFVSLLLLLFLCFFIILVFGLVSGSFFWCDGTIRPLV